MTDPIQKIREALAKIPRSHNDVWFLAPEKEGLRYDGSKYHLDAHVAYGTDGDDSDTFDLIDSYDMDTYRFIAACNPPAIAALLAQLDRLKCRPEEPASEPCRHEHKDFKSINTGERFRDKYYLCSGCGTKFEAVFKDGTASPGDRVISGPTRALCPTCCRGL